jgi:hypothetical protein
MARSMIPGQQEAAWNALLAMPLDKSDGYAMLGSIGQMSRTHALWWVATRT